MGARAINTRYQGYLFRSRLEARWAVYFDAMRWKWEYEMEGYVLSNGATYLPDFLVTTGMFGESLPDPRWVEIKGEKPMDQEIEKLSILSLDTGIRASMMIGTPGNNDEIVIFPDMQQGSPVIKEYGNSYLRKLCDAGPDECAWMPYEELWPQMTCPMAYNQGHPIEDAWVLAKSARFEHGEMPVLHRR